MCSKIVLSVILVMVTITGGSNALRCNACVGSLNSDCARNDTAAFVQQTCLNMNGQKHLLKPVHNNIITLEDMKSCCVYFTLSDSDSLSALVTRDCFYDENCQDSCETIKKGLPSLLACKACETDFCN